MNPLWLYRNAKEAWRYRASGVDFFRRLLCLYGERLPRALVAREREIGFRYPHPVGALRLLVRSNRGADSFVFGEVFHHAYYAFDLPASPATILDLGANAGFTTLFFARTYPEARLACVEPAPENLRVLQRNLELNGIDAAVFPAAAAVADGRVTLELVAKDYGHRVVDAASRTVGNTIEVDGLSVPTVLERLAWSRIGLLKVDIEGYERVLLATDCSWLHLVDAMCIECHDPFGEPELSRIAETFGFLPPRQLPGVWLLHR